MKSIKVKALALCLTVFLSAGMLTGCSKSEKSDPKKDTTAVTTQKLNQVELKILMRGDAPTRLDEIVSEFEKRTKDSLNVKLKIEFTPGNDYKTKLQMMLAASEQFDSCFDANWLNMNDAIAQKLYVDLTSYFNNDKYPGLKNAFSKNLLDNNKFFDKVYAIPLIQQYANLRGTIIRKDLRDKYKLPEIKDLQGLEAYFDKVLENEKGVIPYGMNSNTIVDDWLLFKGNEKARDNIINIQITSGLAAEVALSKDGKSILGITFLGDPEEMYSKYPKPWGSKDRVAAALLARKWYTKGYTEKDVISQKNSEALLKAGKFAAKSGESNAVGFNNTLSGLKSSIPGADIELVFINDLYNQMKPGTISTKYRAANFQAIPVISKNIDRMIMFYDKLFGDKELHDLFEYGIEGKDWEKNGNDKMKIPDTADKTKLYNFQGYLLSWNPTMVRLPAEVPEKVAKAAAFTFRDDTYFKVPLAAFNFNTEAVKLEVAKVAPVFSDEMQVVNLGMLDNVELELQKLNEKAKKLGLEKIREELKKQIEDYIAKN